MNIPAHRARPYPACQTRLPGLLLGVMLLALAGCATNYQAPKVTEGKLTRHGYISVTSEKTSAHEYRIVANGAAVSRVEDVERAWLEFAQKVAAGRPFTKDSTVEDYSYRDAYTYMTFQAKRVVGKITITAEK